MKRDKTNHKYYLWCLGVFSRLKKGNNVISSELTDTEFSYYQWARSDRFLSSGSVVVNGELKSSIVLHREVDNLNTQEFILLFWSKYEKYK